MPSRVLIALTCLALWVLAGCSQPSTGSGLAVGDDAPASKIAGDATGAKVVVYYLHRTFRCAACNALELMASSVVHDTFASEVDDGTVEWKTADFQDREELAKRYGVSGPSVVVVTHAEGKETSHRRLDELWQLRTDPVAFRAALVAAVKKALGQDG